ncbi:MAG: cyclopropane-fatty-acyl-phospholipid synthase family protein [Gammaproteobacteria bacterium]|nr:cyclopropane-fatty-acyl-phospholipid synthase family protein [Gammaproteobacteria bacterium]
MKTDIIDSSEFAARSTKPGKLETLARSAVRRRLQRLSEGSIQLIDGGDAICFGKTCERFPRVVTLTINDPQFYAEVAFGGNMGAGESFVQGYWDCDDLRGLVRILLCNRQVLENVDAGLARLARPAQKVLHWFNRNTKRGSKRNIAAHYDVGNDFYKLWLDERMMYSSAYFETSDASLESASTTKLERICRRLDLQAKDAVIEIGTGWGGFALYAAEHYGCHVTTTTISEAQYLEAEKRVRAAGLEDRITLLRKDYRDLHGQYDKLVSIEMIEAVGHEFHADFFRKCRDLLKPDGIMLLQAITIADQRYDAYKNSVDFIRRYIFPGGCLTSVTDMHRVMTQETDLRTVHLEDFGPHYARTLEIWHHRFRQQLEKIRAQGYSKEFLRMWQYYLVYCEAAFVERATGVVQMLAMRPEARPSEFAR